MCALVTGVQTCALPIFQQPEAQARPGRKPYLMLGHSYYIDVNSVGTRFLLGKPTWAKFEDQRPFLASAWVAATHLFTIESIAGREMWARDHLGEIRRFERSEEHTSELQSLMRISYAVFCLKKKK